MTNQISKAREALDRIEHMIKAYDLEPDLTCFLDDVAYIKTIFTTLSSIDAERLGEALNRPTWSSEKIVEDSHIKIALAELEKEEIMYSTTIMTCEDDGYDAEINVDLRSLFGPQNYNTIINVLHSTPARLAEPDMVLVPREPTQEMLKAAFDLDSTVQRGVISHLGTNITIPIYKAMLAASPTQIKEEKHG